MLTADDALAAGRDHSFLSLGPVAEPLALSGKFSEVQFGGVEGLRYEARNVRLALSEQGECGRDDAASVQGAVVGDGEQPRGVDADEPVGALPAAGGGKEPVIVRPGRRSARARRISASSIELSQRRSVGLVQPVSS